MQVFSSEICEIYKNIIFYRTPFAEVDWPEGPPIQDRCALLFSGFGAPKILGLTPLLLSYLH